MLFYENLEEIIFHRHEMFDVDELIVLSGYVGPRIVGRLGELPFRSSVIYGMYGSDGIKSSLHSSLNIINSQTQNTEILYSKLPVHSKCYIWRKNTNIVTALVGSANFSVSGLSNPLKEMLAETTYDTFNPLNTYLNIILGNCINCSDPTIEVWTPTRRSQQTSIISAEQDVCNATLLSRGEVPTKSGLNWGLSNGHTSLGDAYIPIKIDYILSNPNLFPPKQLTNRLNREGKKSRQNDAVEFIWDDGKVMEGLLEGTQVIGNTIYPKQICSSPRKNILGSYIRDRLGVSLSHLITRRDLERYGRTDIQISLQGEGIYYLDFSV